MGTRFAFGSGNGLSKEGNTRALKSCDVRPSRGVRNTQTRFLCCLTLGSRVHPTRFILRYPSYVNFANVGAGMTTRAQARSYLLNFDVSVAIRDCERKDPRCAAPAVHINTGSSPALDILDNTPKSYPSTVMPLVPDAPLRLPDVPGNLVHPELSKQDRKRKRKRANQRIRQINKEKAHDYSDSDEDDGTIGMNIINRTTMTVTDDAPPARKKSCLRHLAGMASQDLDLDFASDEFREEHVSESGFQGLRMDPVKEQYTRRELEEDFGFNTVPWKGLSPMSLVDRSGHRVAELVGQPRRHEQWQSDVTSKLADKIEESRPKLKLSAKITDHTRGRFPALAHGWTFGGGKEEAGPSKNEDQNEEVWQELLEFKPMQDVARFQSSTFRTYAPRLWSLYYCVQVLLMKWRSAFPWNFAKSVFAAVTVNFGPMTVCFKHLDFRNLSFGWCAITALGRFDYEVGGHLVLWDFKLIIPFPPGSTILLPSALIAHSNTPIQEGETRYSVTQYSAAGLFRWVANDFASDKNFLANANAKQREDFERIRGCTWRDGVEMYVVEEL